MRRGSTRTAYAAWPSAGTLRVDARTYDRARSAVIRYWRGRLAEGARVVVPDRRVQDAFSALLVQNLTLTWRYSVGNPYEQFSFPEGVDVAQVLGELGFADVDRAIMRTSLTRRPTPYPNWKRGEKLLGTAAYFRLYRDRAYVARSRRSSAATSTLSVASSTRARARCSLATATPRTSPIASTGSTHRRSCGRGCVRWAGRGRRRASANSRRGRCGSPTGSRTDCAAPSRLPPPPP